MHGLLQEAFSHPTELCEACFIMDGCRGALQDFLRGYAQGIFVWGGGGSYVIAK